MRSFLAAVAGPDGAFDFQSILPMPDILVHVAQGARTFFIDGEEVSLARWHVVETAEGDAVEARPLTAEEEAQVEALPYTCGHDWRVAVWGCKWPAQDVEVDVDRDRAAISFDTPWSPPEGVIAALRTRFPDLHIAAFFDEPNCQVAGYYGAGRQGQQVARRKRRIEPELRRLCPGPGRPGRGRHGPRRPRCGRPAPSAARWWPAGSG
ncbi:hypothetical protein [uncultured Jannaschia sp.]|uniref:DUF1281 family ferredoxin-like fold protein n=1 Tax=uncultured Jannaschia sp. TaxID=293347 RepID=UPI00263093E3|nr:hypothetical protein [uncultured Jannaschia sp.]